MEMEVYTYLAKISTCIKMALYIYIYIYILRERERDNVSGNNNHRKSHQKTPHSYLSCQHQVGQWLSDHDALQSVTGELNG